MRRRNFIAELLLARTREFVLPRAGPASTRRPCRGRGIARNGETIRIRVQLQNNGTSVALQNRVTLLSARDGTRILPAYLSDNYVSLLPGEKPLPRTGAG